jgi:hypothetical protein
LIATRDSPNGYRFLVEPLFLLHTPCPQKHYVSPDLFLRQYNQAIPYPSRLTWRSASPTSAAALHPGSMPETAKEQYPISMGKVLPGANVFYLWYTTPSNMIMFFCIRYAALRPCINRVENIAFLAFFSLIKIKIQRNVFFLDFFPEFTYFIKITG